MILSPSALLILLLLPAGCGGCKSERPARELGTTDVQLGGRSFRLEIAATEPARRYGLMNRESMPSDRGMIFVFADEQNLEFYMKNTLIPLDIVYLDARGSVVSIKQGKPLQESPTIPSDRPAKYAIELNQGAAAAAGLKVGDKVSIPLAARESAD